MAPGALLRTVKHALFTGAERSRLLSVVQRSNWRRQRLLILCYHGVALDDEAEWNPELYVTADFLRARFALLRDRGYTVLPLADGMRRLHDGTLPPSAVALTFDDGAYDFHARAVPLLREFGYPATLYLTSYYVTDQRPVFTVATSYVAWKGRAAGSCAADGLAVGGEPLRLGTADERRVTVRRIVEAALAAGLSASEKDERLRRFAARLNVDYDRLRRERILHLMTPAEVATLAGAGVDVQLHTHRHRTPRDGALFRRELDDNRRAIEAMGAAAAPLEHFCYPSGDYAPEFLPWLREAGVTTATTCDPGIASAAVDPLLLPRFIDTMPQSAATFEAWVSGFAALLPRRR